MDRHIHHRRTWRTLLVALVLASLLGSISGRTGPDVTHAATFIQMDGPRVYFPTSGQALGGAFLQKWMFEYRTLAIGDPITPPLQNIDTVVQWTEFGRLEYNGTNVATATPDQIGRSKIGHIYADRIGYSRWVSAFRPIDPAGVATRYFYETRHALADRFIRVYETRGNEERLGAPISEAFSIGQTTYQFFEYGALSSDASQDPQFVPLGRMDATLAGVGDLPDDFRDGDIAYSSAHILEMSDAFPGERWIEIDLANYEIVAWAGDTELLRSKVVIGPSQSPTPTGEFSIYIKHEIQNLSGIGWNGQPYYSPGTPWVMYFHQDYGVHGSTWRDEYGIAAGEGCIIPPNDVAEALWKWADYGTRVVVHDGEGAGT